jgi:MFS family permease
MAQSHIHHYVGGLSKDTLLLTGVGLLADISTEMLSPILPLFLTQILKANGSIVGLVDGLAQAVRNIVDGFSGAVSDRFRTRRSIALLGFLLSSIAKPVMGVSPVWPGVLGGRLLDRLGAGIRSAPRDALVASSVPRTQRGGGFGAEGFGDNAGACVGPLLTVLLIYAFATDLRTIFYIAAVPALMACATMLLVHEKTAPRPRQQPRVDISPRQLPRSYWKYLLVIGLFSLGNSSDSFLILRVQEVGASLQASVFTYAGSNAIAALMSFPAGRLSDRWGRKAILLGSLAVFIVTYAGFGLTHDLLIDSALFVFYGLYQGMFRAGGKALAADLAPVHLRASGIGWYSTTVGSLQLVASLLAGLLWDNTGHASAFIFGAIFAGIGLVALIIAIPRRVRNQPEPDHAGTA